jgi:NADPH-dependent 2,4-dienoyl-CoA reductase/sulfur reductase-like enzyme
MADEVDVAIIGAGPSGLAAALALREAGVTRLVVIERETEAGGVPRHCGHPPFGVYEFHRLLTGPAYARRLVAQAKAAGITMRTNTTVTALQPGGMIAISDPDRGMTTLAAKRVLIATGARETPRAARLVSGSRPVGVLTTGALQSFIYLHDRAPFERPVIVGTELVSFSALLTCKRAGIRPQAMIEEKDGPTAYALCAAYPRLSGIPLHYATRLAEIHGRDRVESAVIENAAGQRETISCDGVLFTGRFVPASELVRMGPFDLDPATGGPVVDQYGRLSDPAYYAIGNLLRPIETSAWCHAEGRAAGRTIADDLAGKLPAPGNVTRIACGEGLRYVMPQRIVPGNGTASHNALQLRATYPLAGRLILEADGKPVWSKPIRLKPERRYLLPLATLSPYLAAAKLLLRVERASR